jgi:thioredoxin reductase
MVSVEVVTMAENKKRYDAVVVGGGAAGLSGALTLGRARRSVAVVDAGSPRNAPASGVHGFLSRDGIDPAELLGAGRDEVRRYGVELLDGEAVSAVRDGSGFSVSLADGRVLDARRLLVTTGLVDELPDIAGLRELWGSDIVHCPYCHGWEVRDRALGVLASGPMAVQHALTFRQWSPDLTLFLNGAVSPTAEEAEQLAARGIRVVPGEVNALEAVDGRLTGVLLRDGTVVARQALAVMPRVTARSGVLRSLGLEPVAHPSGLGDHIAADPTGSTAVPGVWVAGNVTDISAQVVAAAAAGVTAGARLNADLIAEDTRHAVESFRDPFSAATEARITELVMGNRRHGF